jgi:hypothetical protein
VTTAPIQCFQSSTASQATYNQNLNNLLNKPVACRPHLSLIPKPSQTSNSQKQKHISALSKNPATNYMIRKPSQTAQTPPNIIGKVNLLSLSLLHDTSHHSTVPLNKDAPPRILSLSSHICREVLLKGNGLWTTHICPPRCEEV